MNRILFCLVAELLVGAPSGLAWAQNARQRLAALQERARIDSNDAVVQYQLGAEYYAQEKWDEAERAWNLATSLSPSYAEPWLGLAMLPQGRGEGYWKRFFREHGAAALDSALGQAITYYRRAYVSNPLVDLAILGKFHAPSNIISTGSGRPLIVIWWLPDFEKGVNDLRESRNEEAWQRFERILHDRRAGDDRRTIPWSLLWHHGLAAARTGRYVEAINDFAILTGRAYAQERSDEDMAVMELTDALMSALGRQSDFELRVHTNELRYVLGTMYFLDGKLGQAIAVYQRVLEFDVGFYQANVQLARIYEAAGRWDDAIHQREQAIAVNPEDPDLVLDLGSTLMRAGRVDRAQEVLSDPGLANSRDGRAPLTLGLVALQRGDTATARAALTRFLAIAPSSFSQQIVDARERLARITTDH